jgi:hypothetical protein
MGGRKFLNKTNNISNLSGFTRMIWKALESKDGAEEG